MINEAEQSSARRPAPRIQFSSLMASILHQFFRKASPFVPQPRGF